MLTSLSKQEKKGQNKVQTRKESKVDTNHSQNAITHANPPKVQRKRLQRSSITFTFACP